jgi:hypothetical protein
MLHGEWNMRDAREVWRQEDFEDGVQFEKARSAAEMSALQEEVRQLRAAAQGQSR